MDFEFDFRQGVKRLKRETVHSPPRYGAEVKNGWRYIATPLYVFIAFIYFS